MVHHLRQPRHVLGDRHSRHGRGDRAEFAADLLGASGFRSQMSIVAGPPESQIWITPVAGLRVLAVSPAASALSISGSDRPSSPAAPAVKKSRR